MTNCHWIRYEGIQETHQLVSDEYDRILGEISGIPFEKKNGWYASDQTIIPAVPLGRYATIEGAKAAVEHHFSKKTASEK